MSASSPHIAFVCWGFPPFRGSGAFRPLAIANAFAAAGAKVTVVAASREVFLLHFGADTSLEDQIDSRIDVVRVPFFPAAAWPLLNDWSPRQAASVANGKKQLRQHNPAEFPEAVYPSWLPRALTALREVHARHPVSLVVGTGGPYVDLEVAYQFGVSENVPMILDDRDCSIFNVYDGEQSEREAARENYCQRWLQACSEMWFVNPPIAKKVSDMVSGAPGKIKVVENGWDPVAVRPEDISPKPNETIRAAYVGLVATRFPLEQLLTIWDRLTREDQAVAPLGFIGPLGFAIGSKRWEKVQETLSQSENAEWLGHVPREKLAATYADLDVLIFAKAGGEFVTGGKPYEYAATGLPIVALVEKESDAMRVLGSYPRVHQAAPNDIEAAVSAIKAALSDSRTDNGTRFRAAQEFGERLSRSRQLEPAVARVMKLAQQ